MFYVLCFMFYVSISIFMFLFLLKRWFALCSEFARNFLCGKLFEIFQIFFCLKWEFQTFEKTNIINCYVDILISYYFKIIGIWDAVLLLINGMANNLWLWKCSKNVKQFNKFHWKMKTCGFPSPALLRSAELPH